MNEDLILTVESQTFADDSFRIADPDGLIVDAQIANWSEFRWYNDLGKKCGPDLKWARVRHRWPQLSTELRRSILRDLRDALVVIVDPTLYRFEMERAIEAATATTKCLWPAEFSAWAAEQIAEREMTSILFDSPVTRIEYFLEGENVVLGESPHEDEPSDSALSTDLREQLGNAHSIRLFGARSAAAFAHVLDRETWISTLEPLIRDMRYLSPWQALAFVLAKGERVQRVFDEGNQRSVTAISDLKDLVRERLTTDQLIVVPESTPKGAVEMSSTKTPALQAGDIAAGYARTLYLENGLRAVCEEFKGVILNGAMVRDWTQLERRNLCDLQVRR